MENLSKEKSLTDEEFAKIEENICDKVATEFKLYPAVEKSDCSDITRLETYLVNQ